MDDMVERELQIYRTPEQRIAYLAALGTAAGICDRIARRTQESNTTRGRVTQIGQAMADVAERCGNELWAARQHVHRIVHGGNDDRINVTRERDVSVNQDHFSRRFNEVR